MDRLNWGLNSLVQNTGYAMPAKQALLFTSSTTSTITVSDTSAFSASVTLTLTNGEVLVSAPFIKCTSGAIAVSLRPA